VSFRLRQGRLVGAVLLGDTDLEETAENLIMDGIDVASLGADMLDPENDLGDYFD
jgi:NAD(P)H-nitrite reductase large subunit